MLVAAPMTDEDRHDIDRLAAGWPAVAHLDVDAALNRVGFCGRLTDFLSRHLTTYTGIADIDHVQQPGYPPVEQHLTLIDELAGADEGRALAAVELHAHRGPGPISQEDTP
jgi:hypothetical protein